MAAGPLHVLLVLLHIVLVTVWFGLALRLQFLARALGSGGPLAGSEEIRQAGNRTVQVMTIAIILFYASAIANFFVGGGFSVYGPTYHTSLLLGFALVLVQVLMIQPAWGRLSGGQPADAKRVSMGIGIAHGLWLVLLVLMFFGPRWGFQWRSGTPEAMPSGASTSQPAP
ncbi:MAG TPA: hypothetical protein VGB53_04585 [Rubricoccaceae bacterium]|jgi:putative copper export protein